MNSYTLFNRALLNQFELMQSVGKTGFLELLCTNTYRYSGSNNLYKPCVYCSDACFTMVLSGIAHEGVVWWQCKSFSASFLLYPSTNCSNSITNSVTEVYEPDISSNTLFALSPLSEDLFPPSKESLSKVVHHFWRILYKLFTHLSLPTS